MTIIIYVLAAIGLLTIGFVLRSYLPGYFGEKGKNLATKEDIAEITKIVRETHAPYDAKLEDLRQKHQLQLAALETRLEKHQQAYELWYELWLASEDEAGVVSAARKCKEWSIRNSLYLSREAREAFCQAYEAGFSRYDLLLAYPKNESTDEFLASGSDAIRRAGKTIVEAMALPPIPKIDTELEKPEQEPGTSA